MWRMLVQANHKPQLCHSSSVRAAATAQRSAAQRSAPQRDLELQRVQAVAVGGAPAAPNLGCLSHRAIACVAAREELCSVSLGNDTIASG